MPCLVGSRFQFLLLFVGALVVSSYGVPISSPLPLNRKINASSAYTRGPYKLPFFYPKNGSSLRKSPTHTQLHQDQGQPLSEEQQAEIGLRFLVSRLGIRPENLSLSTSMTDRHHTTHMYFFHIIDGIPVVNHDCAVHVHQGMVVAWSSSFSKTTDHSANATIKVLPPIALISQEQAVSLALEQVPNTSLVQDAQSTIGLAYVEIPDKTIVYAYHMELRDDSHSVWYKVYVDARSGQIVHAIDYVQYLSYKVIPYYSTNPLLLGFTNLQDPEYLPSSPLGWITTNVDPRINSSNISSNDNGTSLRQDATTTITYNDTRGNNIESGMFLLSRRPGPRYGIRNGTSGGFVAQWDPSKSPEDPQNQEAAIIELFYLGNFMHDLAYQYGFTEEAGNFQKSNFDRGGAGNDPVKMMIQVGGASNNANFKSAPDGRSGFLSISLFATLSSSTSSEPSSYIRGEDSSLLNDPETTILRDGALEPSIVLHEYAHGISTRMCGGAKNPECLQDFISLGLGEGWSDAIAMFIVRNISDLPSSNFTIGAYVSNDPRGIRNYPYTTNMSVNPLTFESVDSLSEPHDVGEVWASILNDVYWSLVSVHGSSENLFESKQRTGNIVLLNLIFQGFLLQPCHPDFIAARDAIFAADKILYQSKYTCELWKGFARRGMGVSAKQDPYKNGFDIPSWCQASSS